MSGYSALAWLEIIEGDKFIYNTEYPLRNDKSMIKSNNSIRFLIAVVHRFPNQST